MRNRSDRLRAFCSVTIDDDFVVHDLRVIEGRKGFFVAMPSRKLADNCPRCGSKNELRSKFCSECGARLEEGRQKAVKRDKVHVDVAHPINTVCREMLQQRVLAAYQEEAAKGAEAAEAGTEEEYYAETAHHEPEPEFGDEDYGAPVEAPEAEEIEIEAEAVVEEAEEEEERELEGEEEEGEEEEEGPIFPLESPRMDIMEKEEEMGNVLESALAEEEPFSEGLEEIEEAKEDFKAAAAPSAPPAQARREPEAQKEAAPGARPARRRSRREEGGGGFGEGIL
jgi:stage V sporulation protein G